MTLFERISYLAKKHDKSLKEVAEELGLSRNAIYQWKTSSPKADTLQKVATYFNVSTDYLLGRTDDPNPNSPGVALDWDDTLFRDGDNSEKEKDVRLIQRAALEMSDDERKVAIDLWKAAFGKVFPDSKKGNDQE
ncbi:helix-turn-helix domain-containing protein [Enterococcus malodoratus]|uniref:helix-turn-helix domain-containing protein n=1 Tax=Enterococcus malodoratus TaxID=71451 RepID=UPI0022E5D43E|nr:helix-turn-helix transcriptional regulator [Enterococcus malodoratus]